MHRSTVPFYLLTLAACGADKGSDRGGGVTAKGLSGIDTKECAADLNGDSVANLGDLSTFASYWASGVSCYEARHSSGTLSNMNCADLDHSGGPVDIADLMLFSDAFQRSIDDVHCTADQDGDGMSGYDEAVVGSDTEVVDTDGDGHTDLDETVADTDPLDATSYPTPGTEGPSARPRLFATSARLDRMRADACYDPTGAAVSGCVPTAQWTDLYNYAGSGDDYVTAFHSALVYFVTKDDGFAQDAVAKADAISQDFGGGGEVDERGYGHLNDYAHVEQVASTYDYLLADDHALMQEMVSVAGVEMSRKQAYENYFKNLMWEMWNQRDPLNPHELPNNACFEATWGVNSPSNNYFTQRMYTTTVAAVAMAGETMDPTFINLDCPGDPGLEGTTMDLSLPIRDQHTFTDPMAFVDHRLQNELMPYIDAYEQGGAWHEGTDYGVGWNLFLLTGMMAALRDGGFTDYYDHASFEYMNEAAYYLLYPVLPDNNKIVNLGDIGSADINLDDQVFRAFLMLTDGVKTSDAPHAERMQWFLNHRYPTEMPNSFQPRIYEFLYYDGSYPEATVSTLPLHYAAMGSGQVLSRSSWQGDATFMLFNSSDRIENHQHADQNTFNICRGDGGRDCWLLAEIDQVVASGAGFPRHTQYKNTLMVDGQWQTYGEGTGGIVRYEGTDEYTYALGEAAGAYSATDDYGIGHFSGVLDRFEREIVHIRPSAFVVYDRVDMGSGFSGSTVENLFHYVGTTSEPGPVEIASQTYWHVRGDNGLLHEVLLPSAGQASITIGDDSWSGYTNDFTTLRMTISPVPSASHRFLNAFVATDAWAVTPEASLVSGDNLVGAVVDDEATWVVVFSEDGSDLAGTTYSVGVGAEHLVVGVVPGATYDITTAAGSTTAVATAQGILRFAASAGSVALDQQ